jgi:hypothetical protein
MKTMFALAAAMFVLSGCAVYDSRGGYYDDGYKSLTPRLPTGPGQERQLLKLPARKPAKGGFFCDLQLVRLEPANAALTVFIEGADELGGIGLRHLQLEAHQTAVIDLQQFGTCRIGHAPHQTFQRIGAVHCKVCMR